MQAFAEKHFKARKIVIISQDDIISISLAPVMQLGVVIICMATFGWLSFASGKYISHQHLLDAKEKQISYTAKTNETLKVQLSDLHHNLQKLDTYFQTIEKFDHAKQETEDDNAGQVAESQDTETKEDTISTNDGIQEEIFATLGNIDDKIAERTKLLENIFKVAGMDINTIQQYSDKNHLPQGGPFIPVNQQEENLRDPVLLKLKLDRDVSYLLYLEEVVHAMPLTRPMKTAYISSGYGYRTDPIKKTRAMHHGVDFVGRYHGRVYSTAPGKVVKAGRNGSYGKFIEIDHGRDITTRYGHLHKVKVQKGEWVERGQIIGLQGSTGRSTGAHLHYEVRYKNTPLNPYNFIKAGEHVF